MTDQTRAAVRYRPGEKWRSRDPRDHGLIVTILWANDEVVRIQRKRKTTVRRDRFRFDYEPVEP